MYNLNLLNLLMVVVAVLAGKRPVDILSMTFAQHTLICSGGYFPEDVQDIMKIMESGKWNIEFIITHEYPLDKLAQAIEIASNTENALNVVIKYNKMEGKLMSEYKLKTGEMGTDEIDENVYTLKTGKIGETVVKGYKKIEDDVVGGYKAIENGVVKGYKKIEDKFVDTFLEKVDQDETK